MAELFHIGLTVKNLERSIAFYRQIAPTMRSFYTEDPDGVPVEFLQLTGEAKSSHN